MSHNGAALFYPKFYLFFYDQLDGLRTALLPFQPQQVQPCSLTCQPQLFALLSTRAHH